MKYLILIFFLLFSLHLIAQTDSIIDIRTTDFNDEVIFLTNRDSVMLDSINNLFDQMHVLENTINSLKDSLYSNYLVKLVYEKYAQRIEQDFDKRLNFIAQNESDYNFIYPKLNPHDMSRTRLLNNNLYIKTLGLYMINEGYFDDCSLFNGYYLNKENITELGFYYYFDSYVILLLPNLEQLVKRLYDGPNECFQENIVLLMEHSKKFKNKMEKRLKSKH